MRIVFAGTPAFAACALEALLRSSHEIVAAYTQPDKPAGRGLKLTPSAVKVLANKHDIPVIQPKTLKDPEAQAQLKALSADVMVVAAYGLILPQAVLDVFPKGCINIHGSLLPRWRGAAPIHRAILANDQETGITIMQMDAGLDTGGMLLKKSCAIQPDETTGSLHDRMALLGGEAIVEALDQLDSLQPEKQNDDDANYADKIEKHEALIQWEEDAETIDRKIRAFNPFPIAFTFYKDLRIKIYQTAIHKATENIPGKILAYSSQGLTVGTGLGNLTITQLQLPGKKPTAIKDLFNAHPDLFIVGERLSSHESS